jgi:hypothetical protein
MTLFGESKSNSVVANYDGDKLDIIVMNGDIDNNKMLITQLTTDDIRNIIASPASTNSLEDRLKSDYNCRYNFRRPTIHQHRGYNKKLREALKSAEMISSIPAKTSRKTKRNRKKPRRKSRTRGIRKKKQRNTKRKTSRNNPTKTMRYTPYPYSDNIDTKLPIETSKTIPIDRMSEQIPETIRELISKTSRSRNID